MMLSWTGKSDGHRWAQSAHRYSRRHWRNSSEIPWVTFPVVKILCSDLFLSSVCLSDSQQSERSLEASEPEAKDRLYHLGRSARCTDKKGPLLKELRTRHSGCSARSSVWRPFKPVQLTGATLHEASPASAAWQGFFSYLPEHCFLLFIRIYFLGKNHGFAVSFIHKYNSLFFRPRCDLCSSHPLATFPFLHFLFPCSQLIWETAICVLLSLKT